MVTFTGAALVFVRTRTAALEPITSASLDEAAEAARSRAVLFLGAMLGSWARAAQAGDRQDRRRSRVSENYPAPRSLVLRGL